MQDSSVGNYSGMDVDCYDQIRCLRFLCEHGPSTFREKALWGSLELARNSHFFVLASERHLLYWGTGSEPGRWSHRMAAVRELFLHRSMRGVGWRDLVGAVAAVGRPFGGGRASLELPMCPSRR